MSKMLWNTLDLQEFSKLLEILKMIWLREAKAFFFFETSTLLQADFSSFVPATNFLDS